MAQLFTYRISRFGRPVVVVFVVAFFVLFGIAAIASGYAMFADRSAPAIGAALWTTALLLALAWNGYWWLLRIAQVTTFDGTTLTWQSIVREGSHPAGEIVRIGSFMVMLVKIEIAGEKPVLLLPRKGVVEFIDAVVEACPAAGPARLSFYARVNAKQPMRSRLTVTPTSDSAGTPR